MFSSFVLVAADQLLNQIGQLGHIYGGNAKVPLVVRTRVAAGLGYGVHSLDPVALFELFSRVVHLCRRRLLDYIGLFNVAMKSKSPTLMVEHQEFYARRGMIPLDPADYLVRPGSAKVVRQGEDATVIAYGHMVTLALEAGSGWRRRVFGLKSSTCAPWTKPGWITRPSASHLKKSAPRSQWTSAWAAISVGPKIAAECLKRFFHDFDVPPAFVAGPDVCIPSEKASAIVSSGPGNKSWK